MGLETGSTVGAADSNSMNSDPIVEVEQQSSTPPPVAVAPPPPPPPKLLQSSQFNETETVTWMMKDLQTTITVPSTHTS